jgi:hypothetical protein
VVSSTNCVFLCLVYPVLPVSLDCTFLIALSVFYNAYLTEDKHLEWLSITFEQFYYTYGNEA